jgi:AraC family transcriptional regulator of adaptative response / DNA-3-methyladenine glycosylase II
VARALRLIDGGALDREGLDTFATRLGIGSRHLTRLFREHVGATPGAVARLRRAYFARQLLEQTHLPVAQVAFAAGFGSVRRFNEAIRALFLRPPGELRRRARQRSGPGIALRVPYRAPLDWEGLLRFLGDRAIPGVERVEDGCYQRTFALDGAAGILAVRPLEGEPALLLRVTPAMPAALLALTARVRRLFDLDADPASIAAALSRDPVLAQRVRARPGLRVAGSWDGFELAARAVLGQQVSVAAARHLAGRIAAGIGAPLPQGLEEPGLTHLFPDPAALAQADPSGLPLPRARAAALIALAGAAAHGGLELGAGASLEAVVQSLLALPGIGPWTAQYVAMRAFAEPDAFPAGDLGIRQALGDGAGPVPEREAERRAERWRPWRAYAAMHLWTSRGDAPRRNHVRRPPAASTGAR